ncbi:MAG: hypothetical protein GY866_32290 [Proteobacteria bacterium]|nr:hypothetical protein [Pseudomonadota bacterium]
MLELRNQTIFFCLFLVWALAFFTRAQTVFGQQYESLDDSTDESIYFLGMKYEFQESQRKTEETNFSDVYQKKSKQEGKGSLVFYFFHLDGHFKGYESTVSVDDDEARILDSRDTLSAWIQLFEFTYVFNRSDNLKSKYTYIDDSVLDFHEGERARSYIQGIGFVLGSWRLGYSPETSFKWSYQVDVLGQSVIDEDIEFDVNVFEITKRAEDKEGPYFELGLKKWDSKKAKDDRTGSLERIDSFVVVGMGFSENSGLFIGEKISKGKIATTLLADGSAAERESVSSNPILGFEIGLTEDSSIYMERELSNSKIDFENVSFSIENKNFEDSVTIGTRLNQHLRLELKTTKTIIEKKYTEQNQTYNYKQTDDLIGVSLRLRFPE